MKSSSTKSSNTKQTSHSVASKASSILRDNRFSATAKTVAGSALSQTKSGSSSSSKKKQIL